MFHSVFTNSTQNMFSLKHLNAIPIRLCFCVNLIWVVHLLNAYVQLSSGARSLVFWFEPSFECGISIMCRLV